ncbi:PCSK9 convertase, partial [Chroicocephalus maculipennis]|nr:PCSK9 convertase [Chroicocephalus maculipennis]
TARRLQARAARRGYLTELLHIFHLLPAFLVKMSGDVLDTALKLPHVEYVEEDAYVFAQSIPWNLGRIVPPQPGSGAYSPPNKGDLVEIYLLDTSVQSTHREIAGRVLVTDFESVPEEDGTRFHRQVSPEVPHAAAWQEHPPAPSKPWPGSWGVLGQGGRLVHGKMPGRMCSGGNCGPGGCWDPQRGLFGAWLSWAGLLSEGSSRRGGHGASGLPALGTYLRAMVLGCFGSFGCCSLRRAPAPLGVWMMGCRSSGGSCLLLRGVVRKCQSVPRFSPRPPWLSAGIAAMLLSAEPQLSLAELRQRLLHFATKNVMDVARFPEEQRLQTPNSVAGLPARLGAEEQLYCRSVWSARSGLTRHATAVARCAGAEEMLSCSSFSRSGRRLGEHMEDKDGQKQCVAHNAFRGQGVYAIARCCTWPRAECRINTSSQVAEGADCSPRDHVLTGCSFHSPAAALGDGGRPVVGPGSGPSRCAGRTEVTAHALCCPAAGLECRVKERTSPGSAEKVTVSCDDGWTLTGCSAHSQSPGTMGAYAVDDTCVAASVPGSSTAVAIAICCRSR